MAFNFYTKFENKISNNLEDILIELIDYNNKNFGFTFHFIGENFFRKIKEDEVDYAVDFPNRNEEEREKYVQQKIDTFFDENQSYQKLEGLFFDTRWWEDEELMNKYYNANPNLDKLSVYLNMCDAVADFDFEFYQLANLEEFRDLIVEFNSFLINLFDELIKSENDLPKHRPFQVSDYGIYSIFNLIPKYEDGESKLHKSFLLKVPDLDLIVKELEVHKTNSIEFRNFVNEMFDVTNIIGIFYKYGRRTEYLTNDIYLNEFWSDLGHLFLNNNGLASIIGYEGQSITELIFKEKVDHAKNLGLDDNLIYENSKDSFRYPTGWFDAHLFYESFEEEIIISSHSFLAFMSEKWNKVNSENPNNWIPFNVVVFSEDNYTLSNDLFSFIINKLYHFEQDLPSILDNLIKENNKIFQNTKQAGKYLILQFQRVLENKKLKFEVLKGIKFNKKITNLFVDSTINLIKYHIKLSEGKLSKYIVPDSSDIYTSGVYDLSNSFLMKLKSIGITIEDETTWGSLDTENFEDKHDYENNLNAVVTEDSIDYLHLKEKFENHPTVERSFFSSEKIYWDSNKIDELECFFYLLYTTNLTEGEPFLKKDEVEYILKSNFSCYSGSLAPKVFKFNGHLATIENFVYKLFYHPSKKGKEDKFRFVQFLIQNIEYPSQKITTRGRIMNDLYKRLRPLKSDKVTEIHIPKHKNE